MIKMNVSRESLLCTRRKFLRISSLAAAATAGTKWAVVECETRRGTYEDVEKSAEFLGRFKRG